MIKGIAHNAYVVNDTEASLDFYVNKLGFQQKFTLDDEEGNPWIIYIQIAPNQFIELFPTKEPVPNDFSQSSYRHLCLEVTNIRELVQKLKDSGVAIDQDVMMGLDNNYQAWIHDPDNNPIELMEYGKNSLQLQE